MNIVFSEHTKEAMQKRGTTEEEVCGVITKGKWNTAKYGRYESNLVFLYDKEWNGNFYHCKQVNPIFVQENNDITVITVYVFYDN